MFIVRTVVVKPDGTAWYQHDAALGAQTLGDWVKTQTGIVRNRTRKLGKNKRVNTMVFADQAAAEAYQAAAEANPLYQAKQAHATANGFVRVVRKFQVVQ